MAKRKESASPSKVRQIKPALTPEGREDQCVALAYDLVRQRLLEGTASSQETTHFLKLAARRTKLEEEKAAQEIELLKAKKTAIASAAEMEGLVAEALNAFRGYSPQKTEEEDDFYDNEEDY